MKQLSEVVKMRNELRAELENFKNARRDVRTTEWEKLSYEEKREYNHICMVIQKLNVQIDTLTYVINYDSKLPNVTIPPEPKQAR